MRHICLWDFIHPCMPRSLSGSTLIQDAGFGLAIFMGGLCCSFSAVVFVQFRGLCFSGMSLLANQSRRPAACFLLHSYTSAGFRGETGQKAEKQKKGGEAGRQRNTNALPSKSELPLSPIRCMWELVLAPFLWHKLQFVGKGLAHMLTARLFILHFDNLFWVIYTHVFPSSRRPVFGVSQE